MALGSAGAVILGTTTLVIALMGGASMARADQEVHQVVATTRDGQPVTATLIGPQDSATVLVVIGQMHGTEPAGRRVVALLAGRLSTVGELPPDTSIWLVSTMNPEGAASGARTNNGGVDLNRNFPQGWVGEGEGTTSWSGPNPASEPETQGMMNFLRRVHPSAVISFHQPFGVVDISHLLSEPAGRQMAKWMGIPARAVGCPGPCHGTLTGWVDRGLATPALTVELPARVSPSLVARSASAVVRLLGWLSQ